MTIEENARIMELSGMMEALGLKSIKQEETEEGIYLTYLMKQEAEVKEIKIGEEEIPAAE